MAGPSPDGRSYLLDNGPNSFTLTPGFLTPYPNGLFALGGNDFIVGASDADRISGDDGNDRLMTYSTAVSVTISSSATPVMIPCREEREMTYSTVVRARTF